MACLELFVITEFVPCKYQIYFKTISLVVPFFRHQRNKLKLDDVPKLPEWQRLRLQHCSNDMSVPNLVIRRASVVQGHGDIFQRKNSGGKISMLG
jgi:hypothetical protein